MIKKDIENIISKVNNFSFEIKNLERFIQKVNLINELFEKLRQLPPEEVDNLSLKIIEDIHDNVIGLTYSLEYVRGDIARLDLSELSLLKEKLHSIGYTALSLVRMFFPISGKEYLNALHSSKALINYENVVINSLDFEIRMIGYRLNKKTTKSNLS